MSQTHPTPIELHAAIPAAARRPGFVRPLAIFTLDYSGFLCGVFGACLVPGWWLKVALAMLAAASMGGLFIIGHDAAHGSFVASRKLNRWLARCAFFPTLTPLASWMHAHNYLHHRFLRVRHRDIVWMPWSLAEYRGQPWWRRVFYRLMRTPLGLPFYWSLYNWLPHHLFPDRQAMQRKWGRFQLDRLYVAGFVIVLYGALVLAGLVADRWSSRLAPVGPVPTLFWGFLLPYCLWSFLIGLVDLVQHTHPRSIWFADKSEWDYAAANLRSSTHILLPLRINRLWHNILVHTAHHVDPGVPLYRLPQAQQSLEQAYPDDVITERLTLSFLYRLFRVCRLYDFQRKQWLDYDGTPTSPSWETQAEHEPRLAEQGANFS